MAYLPTQVNVRNTAGQPTMWSHRIVDDQMPMSRVLCSGVWKHLEGQSNGNITYGINLAVAAKDVKINFKVSKYEL